MHQNKSGLYKNNLSNHAALLLSASPTIVTSPLHNPQLSTPISKQNPSQLARRISTAPLVLNDNLEQLNQSLPLKIEPLAPAGDGPSQNCIPSEGYINFKKPQNEIFKKLDGKIQKIVAAHSNLNKLYALNDFSGIGTGPKRPFELPPQLPPPPPCVPKATSPTDTTEIPENYRMPNMIEKSGSRSLLKISDPAPMNVKGRLVSGPHEPSNNNIAHTTKHMTTIDSAISKLHQRRQGTNSQHSIIPIPQIAHQRPDQPRLPKQQVPVIRPNYSHQNNMGSTSSSNTRISQPNSQTSSLPRKPDPAMFIMIAQKIKEVLDYDNANKSGSADATSHGEKKKFQENLINLLKRQITLVAKSANIDFSSSPKPPPPPVNQNSLLRSSPQSLFKTIHRETSLLLKQRNANRSTLSILPTQQQKIPQFRPVDRSGVSIPSQQVVSQKISNTIKVVLPPSEYHSDDIHMSTPRKYLSSKPGLSYKVIKNKIQMFQEQNLFRLSRVTKVAGNQELKRNIGPKRVIDKIVDRLQARCSTGFITEKEFSDNDDMRLTKNLQNSSNNAASLIRKSGINNLPSHSTPIPVFRFPYGNTSKGMYYNRMNALKALSLKSKKNKKLHSLGLRLSSYLERESIQPTQDEITIEDYARCLNLVRPNDISLQRHKERLLQSESRWKLPNSNRPIRLRRIKGERIHMPASASYRAASKAGLQ